MGRITVDVTLANAADIIIADRGLLSPNKIRKVTIPAIVDTRATRLALPASVAKELGLQEKKKIAVEYADGRRAVRPMVSGVWLQLLDRDDTFSALVEPKRKTALVGAIVMEALDLLADCGRQTVYPRDPERMTFAAE